MLKNTPFIKEETKTKTTFKIARLSLLAAFVLCIFVILINFIINIAIYYKQAITPTTLRVIYIIFAIMALVILIAYFVVIFVGNHFILKERRASMKQFADSAEHLLEVKNLKKYS